MEVNGFQVYAQKQFVVWNVPIRSPQLHWGPREKMPNWKSSVIAYAAVASHHLDVQILYYFRVVFTLLMIEPLELNTILQVRSRNNSLQGPISFGFHAGYR